jgi:isocitrate dehydrogenase (NAD+)
VGKGVANPLALLLAATMMLDHIDRRGLAHQLRKAIRQTLNEDNVRTCDLGGTASTKEFAQAIVGRLKR